MKNQLHFYVRATFALLMTAWIGMSAAWATDYYVSTTGNDGNDGSPASPWRTLTKAFATVAPNAGHTIRIGAGTFTEADILTLPRNVSLIGAGSSQTIIRVNNFFTLPPGRNVHIETYPERFVIQVPEALNQTFRGFQLDGQNRQNHGGIFVRKATNVVVDDVFIHDFRYSGIWFPELKNVEVKNSHLKDNTYAAEAFGDSGNLLFHSGEDFFFHDNLVEEKGAIRDNLGGYGLKAQWLFYKADGFIRNFQVYNNTITVPEIGAWNNQQAPAITIEFQQTAADEVDIHNNVLNNTISWPYDDARTSKKRIHHNYFKLGNSDRYAYAIEDGTNDIEIDHNYFEGGIYPIGAFGGDPRNQVIHHNVFYDQRTNREVILLPTPKNFKLYNNTFIDNTGISRFLANFFSPMTLNNPDVRNNLFVSPSGNNRDIFGANVTGGRVDHNGFYNVVPKGTNVLTANPNLAFSGGKPAPYFELQPGSQAINAGVSVPGITDDAIGVPDLGAFEVGTPSQRVGIITSDTQAPTTPTALTGTPTSTFVVLKWKAAYDENYVQGYRVYQNGALVGTVRGQTFKVSGLSPSTNYSFAVKAFDFTGNVSPTSNTVSVNTSAPDTQAPSAPANLEGTNTTPFAVTLTWSASTDNEGIGTYYVYKNGALLDSAETTSYAVSGLNFLTTYVFTVKAKDYVGNVSAASAPLSVTTPEPDLDVTARGEINEGEGIAKIHDGDLNSKWLDISTTSWVQFRYKIPQVWSVYRITSGNDEPGRDPKNWTLKGSNDAANWVTLDTRAEQSWSGRNQTRRFRFTNTTAYKYYYLDITANSGSDVIQVSELAYANEPLDLQPPTAPTNLKASEIKPKSVRLSWKAATDNLGVTGYQVFKDGQLVATSSDTTYLVTQLNFLTTYVFTVKALDADENASGASAPLSVTTPEPDLDVTARGEINEGEGIAKIHDGDLNSKWLDISTTSWVQFRYKIPQVWSVYRITSGNDEPGRDPKNWTLKGSNDGSTWTVLDTRQNESWSGRNQMRSFAFTNTTAYKYYYLDITANSGSNVIQVSELAYDGLEVWHQNDSRQLTNNQIRFNLKLVNVSNAPVPLGELTARYWLTAEEFAPINSWIDYAQVGNGKVKLQYVPLEQPRQGAFGYLEYRFEASAGSLAAGGNSGPIQSRIGKADWTPFNETDDYSYATNSTYAKNPKITLYRNEQLVWGSEPATVPVVKRLTVQTQNRNNTPTGNQISTNLTLTNTGNVPVDYQDLKVRYWFTAEGTQALNAWLDYAKIGSSNVQKAFTRLSPSLAGADTYFELGFKPSLGELYPLSTTGDIQYRLAKTDWSLFNEANDHSYKAAAPLADNDHVTVYYKGVLVYGTEPTTAPNGRLAAEKSNAEALLVEVYPNPANAHVVVRRGTSAEAIDVTFYNGGGHVVQQLKTRFNAPIRTEQLPTGLYLLRVETGREEFTLKVLKQ